MSDAATASYAQGLAPVTPTSAGVIISAMNQSDGGAPAIPKPFSQPICLMPSTRVAGTTHVKDIDSLVATLAEGDRLRLERDMKNHYDAFAIRVLDAQGRRLGFVPTDVNEIPARLMDGGKRLYAQVVDIVQRGSWWHVRIGLWLDD